jgi:hypothetical protein
VGWELARVTTGWATEGTQSEGTTEVHLQPLRPRCGRRETTAAHVSVVWASPEQEDELAVTGRLSGMSDQQEVGAVGRAVPISPTESLCQW